jgi:hypothetical protein
VVWIAGSASLILVVFEIIALVDLVRRRHTMETWQIVVWVVAIVLIPLVGLFTYLLWRISRSDALVDSMDFQDKYAKGNTELPPRL